ITPPSGLNATPCTENACPVRANACSPVSARHARTALSFPPLTTSLPSRLNAAQFAPPACPATERASLPVPASPVSNGPSPAAAAPPEAPAAAVERQPGDARVGEAAGPPLPQRQHLLAVPRREDGDHVGLAADGEAFAVGAEGDDEGPPQGLGREHLLARRVV